MKKLKYIGFYSDEKENRNYVLSARNKMDYIAESILKEVEIISPSWTYDKCRYKSRQIIKSEQISVILGPTLPWGNKINKIISIIFSYIWLFFYLILNVKKNENIIVYHSLWLVIPIYIVKKFKKFNLILEVEEIYSDVLKNKYISQKMEKRLFDVADKYIFSTELLNEKLNKKNKPYAIIYGTYKVEKEITSKLMDGKIHLVYAGTLDPRKGCMTAVLLSKYLNKNYHIHIIGFGKEEEKNRLLDLIEKTSFQTECKVTFDGLLKGKEYIKFIQKCHIGLSPQSSDAKYNETSFPSKVLSYMSNGLRVVSIKLKTLEISKIKTLLYFYDSDNPKDIAKKILEIDFQDNYDSKKEIVFLDKEFKKNINKILEKKND